MRSAFAIILLFVFVNPFAKAQNREINEFTTLRYDNTISFGPLVHTRGLGLNFQYLKSIKVNSHLLFSLDIVNLKHAKETKVVNLIYDDAKRYVYGKINTAFPLKPGIGSQFIIADKENVSGIRLSGSFVIGSVITLLKPEFLKIIYYDQISGKPYAIDERYDPNNSHHANQTNIYGGTSFFTGFNELAATIGLFGKAWLTFEWNDDEDSYQALETGLMIDAYPEALPLMAMIDNRFIFTNLFVNFSLGKRW
ncbi:MAG: hypothetical protein ISR55_06150 [Bacteroidetes bacterium]|nr:hypothetical protein [Bacteroidota bacterium]